MARSDEHKKSVTLNRRAKHLYHLEDTIECGIELRGTEVKSLRAGHASIQEAYARIKGGELWLIGANIPEYKHASAFNHKPERDRKLLIHKRELAKLHKRVKEKGITLVPIELYFRGHLVKLELATARGKKSHDKREAQKTRDARREMDRAMGRRR